MFITFEGPEGAGKTTQVTLLAEKIRAEGHMVITTRQPGGEELGKRLRSILLDKQIFTIEPMAELLLMMADRAQSVERIIRPALDSGAIVICDRYIDSSVAYQGIARRLGVDIVKSLNEIATSNLVPNITYLLDIDAATGLARQNEKTRIEEESQIFHEHVREGFLQISRANPDRIKVVDSSMSLEDVSAVVWRIYSEANHRNRA